MSNDEFDTIGKWTEDKLNILKDYVSAYTKILDKQPKLKHEYIDGFSAKGQHISRDSGDIVAGSPILALRIQPRFDKYTFIDIDQNKTLTLQREVDKEIVAIPNRQPEVIIKTGDCNQILLNEVLPSITFSSYRRAICFLDPYGTHLDWKVIQKAGELETIDVFINFSISDMNRNAIRKDPTKVSEREIVRMNTLWGDESWRDLCYDTQGNLFNYAEKRKNDEIAEIFRKRLKEKAGFNYVPRPVAMKNRTNSTLYYLFFASAKTVASKIITHIFKKYR
ncbi:MAG: three-Cys-motif partner protein TcmP [candidate division Zixibacteria bacterium]|nr:three-Cys-motif partner protein TcmP [candidate division Zixibacteria bacterium]